MPLNSNPSSRRDDVEVAAPVKTHGSLPASTRITARFWSAAVIVTVPIGRGGRPDRRDGGEGEPVGHQTVPVSPSAAIAFGRVMAEPPSIAGHRLRRGRNGDADLAAVVRAGADAAEQPMVVADLDGRRRAGPRGEPPDLGPHAD